MDRLPIEKEIEKLPKQWLINVIYTIVGDQFAQWVKDRIEERNQRMLQDRGLVIEMDQDVQRAFSEDLTKVHMAPLRPRAIRFQKFTTEPKQHGL